MSEKKLNLKDYKLDETYKAEEVEFNEEIDGNFFPDRDEHLKKKDEARNQYKKIKDSMATNRVRR